MPDSAGGIGVGRGAVDTAILDTIVATLPEAEQANAGQAATDRRERSQVRLVV